MGLLNSSIGGSPVQEHPVLVATDLYIAAGNLESLGSPHPYINQDGLTYLRLNEAQILPWTFTGLPKNRTNLFMVQRSKVQILIFPKPETIEQLRKPPRTHKITFYLPLLTIQGEAPFLGDAQIGNFLDSWKGQFLPVLEANIQMLAEGPARIPPHLTLLYINRDHIQGYLQTQA